MPDCFDAYGRAAEKLSSPILMAGRHHFQSDFADLATEDIRQKLRIEATDRLLEVGCNVGLLLTPLARFVREAVGIDHPSCIKKYHELGVPRNVTLVAGRWPETEVHGSFERILVYSVLHYIPSAPVARRFIDACVHVLAPGGILMLGDVPNVDAAGRFAASTTGQAVHVEYERDRLASRTEEAVRAQAIFKEVEPRESFLTDAFVCGLMSELRNSSFETYIVPQPLNLPFSLSREDILIWRRH